MLCAGQGRGRTSKQESSLLPHDVVVSMMSWATQSAAFIGGSRGDPLSASHCIPTESVILGIAASVGRNAGGDSPACCVPGAAGCCSAAHCRSGLRGAAGAAPDPNGDCAACMGGLNPARPAAGDRGGLKHCGSGGDEHRAGDM